MEHLAYDFDVAKSTVSDTIIMVENVLVQDGTFRLPGKKALLSKENAGRKLAVDVTESPIERPKKNKKMVFGQEKTVHNAVFTVKGAKSLLTLTLRKLFVRIKPRVPFTISGCSC